MFFMWRSDLTNNSNCNMYENVYYCTKCKFMQIETYFHSITLPCPKCGNNYYSNREPETILQMGDNVK